MIQLPLHSVNAMRRCFGLNPIIVKGGTHTYMIKDEQLPNKCHEQYRCSKLLKRHRPMVKIKEETYAKEQGVQAPPEHTQKKTRFGLIKGAGQCFIFWSGETVSFLARHLVLARRSCSSTSFVGSSDHLLSLELRQWVRMSC